MKKGFLLIDGMKNTILLTHEDFLDIITYAENTRNSKWLRLVKQHKTKQELNKDISNYLKGEYNQEEI